MSPQQRVLFIGQSGAGKSKLVNALFNNDVSVRSLTLPATVTAFATGAHDMIQTFQRDESQIFTDVVGCDSMKFCCTVALQKLQRVLQEPCGHYTHLVLCLPNSRITDITREFLRRMPDIFGPDFMARLILYIGHCDDGTTNSMFCRVNSDDPDLAPIIHYMQKSENRKRFVTGSLMHHSDERQDRMHHLQDRRRLLRKIKAALQADFLPLRSRSKTSVCRDVQLPRTCECQLAWNH